MIRANTRVSHSLNRIMEGKIRSTRYSVQITIIKELLKNILIHKFNSIIQNLGRKQRLSLLVNLCVQHAKSQQ